MKVITYGAVKRLASAAAVVAAIGTMASGAGAHAAVHKTGTWPTTIQAAEQRWPTATLIKAGTKVQAGRYIFKDETGHYDLLSVTVSVSPLSRAGRGGLAGRAGQAGPSRAAYCTGCVYGVTDNVSVSSFLWGNQWFDTYNGVKYGYYAWNIYATPGCSGAGTCQSPSIGVIGNYTATVNPWDNQYVSYWGCCSGTTYLRAYVTKWNGVSGWAKQYP